MAKRKSVRKKKVVKKIPFKTTDEIMADVDYSGRDVKDMSLDDLKKEIEEVDAKMSKVSLGKASDLLKKESDSRKKLEFKEPMVDKVTLLSHSWRDQKTLTVLGDNGVLYVFSARSNKLVPMYKNLGV